MKGLRILSLAALMALTQQASAYTLPVHQIIFDNHTALSLGATIAGLPGKDIPPNTANFAVPFGLVFAACIYSTNPNSCPVNFKNKNNDEDVASVYINVITGEVVSPPTLHGSYGASYTVTGWETKPINRITINNK